MADVTKEQVLAALSGVKAPDGAGDIVAQKLVSDIFIADGKAFFSITVPASRADQMEPLRLQAVRAVEAVPGVAKAVVALTAERGPGAPQTPPPLPRTAAAQTPPPLPISRPHAHPHSHAPQGGQPQPGRAPGKAGIPGVDAIIAVASGKGGVGKSTTAVNLALGLSALGLKVGVLDADIYGPSMPRLFGLNGKPETIDGKTMKPMERYGLKVMSIGFLVEEDTPMIWRGPMVMSALTQMMRDVAWGTLDVLVVDMPPGTGDAQLTMAQQVPLAGAVIVSTPQDLALIDARKGLNMFRRVEVPVLGIVENMSYFVCPDCGGRHDIFGHGGARAEAERIGVPFLGEVPLTMAIRETSDAGTPVVASDPSGAQAAIYRGIAEKVRDRLAEERAGARAPSIVFE